MDARTRALHELGWLELDDVPEWELLAFCERMHATWNERCIELLDGLRERWWDGEEQNERPGAVAAREANAVLSQEHAGIYLSATHASVDEQTWEFTGPRFGSYINRTHRRARVPRPARALR